MKKSILFVVLCIMSLNVFAQDKQSNVRKIGVVNAKTYTAEVAKGVVLVDYWAVWCGPCRKMEPILKEIAAETDVKVTKLNVDDNKAFVRTKNVSTIPTMIIYKEGVEVERLVGVYSKTDLLEVLNRYK